MKWTKKDFKEIRQEVFDALDRNSNFTKENVLGIPASYLDPKVFAPDSSVLNDAPFLTTLVKNPNHIGCHTLGHSESFFRGTQELEREVIALCAEEILHAEPRQYDGYIASGGTEANIQAIWIYRNYFVREKGAQLSEISILCSSESHYSMNKASDLLAIDIAEISVNPETMSVDEAGIEAVVTSGMKAGKKYFIVVANMMTTMFGSVDDPDLYATVLRSKNVDFKLHVDGAYGGFYYPFSKKDFNLHFGNPNVSSVTLDAHKMAQAPYGTGIFIARKGLMSYAHTAQASYVEGEDSTLIGSRSGANAVAVWMILHTYGRYGWVEKIFILQKRTDWFVAQLDERNIAYYRNPFSNIVTIRSSNIHPETALKFGLVPDNHSKPQWYKVVVMEHVEIEKLEKLLDEMQVQFN